MAPTPELIPSMARAVEQRREELGLSPSEFSRRSGVTLQGLSHVRKGERRRYQLKVKRGVAKALEWPDDAIDRLMAGEDPATFVSKPTWLTSSPDELLAVIRSQGELLEGEERRAYFDALRAIIDDARAEKERRGIDDAFLVVRLSALGEPPLLLGLIDEVDDEDEATKLRRVVQESHRLLDEQEAAREERESL